MIRANYLKPPSDLDVQSDIISNKILASVLFEAQVLAYDFIQNKGMTNAEILSLIRRDIQITYTDYRTWPWSSAVASTSGTTTKLSSKLNAVNDRAVCKLHELCHATGNEFEHSFRWTETRDLSVPYGIQHCAENVLKLWAIS